MVLPVVRWVLETVQLGYYVYMVLSRSERYKRIAVGSVFVLMMIVLPFIAYRSREASLDTSTEAADSEVFRSLNAQDRGAPDIVSLAPKSARVGYEYKYYLQIVDSNTPLESISVRILQGPEWLELNPDNFLLHGIPEIGGQDTQHIVLEISDGEYNVEEDFYILIEEDV